MSYYLVHRHDAAVHPEGEPFSDPNPEVFQDPDEARRYAEDYELTYSGSRCYTQELEIDG